MAGLALCALLFACSPKPAAPPPTPQTAQPVAVLGQVINQVLAHGAASTQFLPATAGLPLGAGSRLRTLAGALARLDFPDGSYLRLGPGSDVTVDSDPSDTGLPTLRARLFSGKLWAIMNGSTLQVYSAAGVAILSGSRASVEYVPGDASQAGRITLIVDCLEADCNVLTEANRYDLHNGEEQLVSANGNQDVHTRLPDNALRDFLAQNPESVGTASTASTATAPEPATTTPAVLLASPSPIAVSATPAPPSATLPPPPTLAPPPPRPPVRYRTPERRCRPASWASMWCAPVKLSTASRALTGCCRRPS